MTEKNKNSSDKNANERSEIFERRGGVNPYLNDKAERPKPVGQKPQNSDGSNESKK